MRARAAGRTMKRTVTVAGLTAGLSLGGVAALVAPPEGAGAPGDLAFGPDRFIGQAARNPSSPFLRMGPAGRVYAAWTEDDPTPAPPPRPAVDPSHRGHWMITFDMRVVLLASSGDGGATWTAPRRVNSVTEAAQGEENEPKIAFAPDGRALVAWSIPSEKGDKSRANVRLAMDDGKGGFTPSRTLNEIPNAARFPLLEQAPDNTFLLAWIDRRVDNPTPRALYVGRIGGGGQQLGRSYKVAEDACDCCRLGVAFADQGRTVYLVHREVGKDQIRNHVLRKSTDAGLTFGAPVTISDDGWQTGCPHSGPAIAVDRRGQLHVTWFTLGRAPGEAGIYYSVSRDAGQTFAPRVLVQANTAPEILHTTLAVGEDGAVHFAWDNLDERSRSQVFVRSLAPDGATWTPAQRISAAKENARRPALALSTQALHVAWTETEGETSRVMLRSAPVKR